MQWHPAALVNTERTLTGIESQGTHRSNIDLKVDTITLQRKRKRTKVVLVVPCIGISVPVTLAPLAPTALIQAPPARAAANALLAAKLICAISSCHKDTRISSQVVLWAQT